MVIENVGLELPTLRMSDADDPLTSQQFRTDLLQATHEVGFFYLTDHGIDLELMRGIIAVAREFFALPDAEKLSVEMVNSPHFRGYNRVGGELTGGKTDWREQIDIAPEREPLPYGAGHPDYNMLQGPNQWPAALPRLREVVQEWNAMLEALAGRLLAQWALALGQQPTVFDSAFGDRPATLTKMVRYPGKTTESATQGVGWHNDPGVLTLLLVEPGTAGLQIEHDGEVVDAPPLNGAFIVNIGEMLEWATDGYLKATKHRVLAPEAGTDRISVPYFHNPALEATFPKIELPTHLAAHAAGITLDESNPILDVFGHNILKARLRAHPDVVAAHHSHLQPPR
ncbi:MAG: isopenicillin N synthase family oxygenase [Actinomycetota bacterium]|nr:isopenicillin N synthase family oxygenase [Actinomycetota bacterium]